MCYLWQPALIVAQVVTNGTIALAYYTIPIILLYFIGRRPDIPNPLLFGLFAIFILACGTTHLMKIVTIWRPLYWLDTYIDGITALASLGTAAVLIPLVPGLLRTGTVEAYLESRSRTFLADQNAALETANERLERANAELSSQMSATRKSIAVMADRESRIRELLDQVASLQARLGAQEGQDAHRAR